MTAQDDSALADGTRSAGTSHRLVVRVPASESWMDEWWAAQDQPSASVRLLVRKFIAEHGCVDAYAAVLDSVKPDKPSEGETTP